MLVDQSAIEKLFYITVNPRILQPDRQCIIKTIDQNGNSTGRIYSNQDQYQFEIEIPKNTVRIMIYVKLAYNINNISVKNVEKLEHNMNGYISDGLILYLDRINKSRYTNYGDSGQIWYDLSDSINNANIYNCINNSNNIGFNGSSSYAMLPSNALGNYTPSTIDLVLKAENESVIFADNCNI